MCPLKREQDRRETQQWFMRRLPTADSIVEIERKVGHELSLLVPGKREEYCDKRVCLSVCPHAYAISRTTRTIFNELSVSAGCGSDNVVIGYVLPV